MNPTDTFVLVWFDSELYTSPEAEKSFRAYDFGKSGRAAHPAQAHVMQVIEDRGDWLRVADPVSWLREDSTSIHCLGSGAFWVENFSIELWVRADDLVPVLSQSFARSYDDGTFITLQPGTPIVGGHAWAKGYHFPVSIPEEIVALRYRPASTGTVYERKGFTLVHADQPQVALGGSPVEWNQEISNYASPPFFRVNGDQTHSYEASGCGAFELSFKGQISELNKNDGVLGMLRSGGQKKVEGIEIPEGAELFWPSGTRAGMVVKTFRQGGSSKSDGARTCLKVPLGTKLKTAGYRNDHVTVCVDTDAVRSVVTRPPPSKNIRSAENSVTVLN
ncbi:MAG: hypothetical protein JKY56_12670 [Kofleriaceae bacterium]|nr:hypothetical protein [Kofleriaceae bacterium]